MIKKNFIGKSRTIDLCAFVTINFICFFFTRVFSVYDFFFFLFHIPPVYSLRIVFNCYYTCISAPMTDMEFSDLGDQI